MSIKTDAENVLETAIELIRTVIVKHETAVIEEFNLALRARVAENERISAERAANWNRAEALSEFIRISVIARGDVPEDIRKGAITVLESPKPLLDLRPSTTAATSCGPIQE